MTKIDAFYQAVFDFYHYFFGVLVHDAPTVEQNCLKVMEELGEYAGAVFKGRPQRECEDEWADTLFALLHQGFIAGYDMGAAMERVAAKNRDKYVTAIVRNGAIIKLEDAS